MLGMLWGALALLVAHVLPGFLPVRLLGLGRDRFDRFVMAAVFGGPIAAAACWAALVSGRTWVYGGLLVAMDVAALALFFRKRPRSRSGELSVKLWLLGWTALLAAVYYLTTGVLFAPDASGNLVLDTALQRDTLFHVGLVRSLESSYPPELLSMSGTEARYHVGYDLQVAAWSRFFGVDPLDGVYRIGPLWSLALLSFSAFGLGLRFHESARPALASAVLLFGTGLGFLFFYAPGADWWSLVFLDAALVSLFLVNPLLPALPLLFVGLSNLSDYVREEKPGALVGAALGLVSLLTVKLFLGAQILAALAIAGALLRGRLRRCAVVTTLAAAPFVLELLLAASASNTSVSARPLELVRYSTEKVGWDGATRLLADVGAGRIRVDTAVAAVGLALFWLVGFLGLRLAALPRLASDLRSQDGLRRVAATFVALGFPLALVLRVAPSEATGLSRAEAVNDVLWLATQSGLLLWFWTAEALSRVGTLVSAGAALVAFPGTIQHFVYHQSLPHDVVPSAVVEISRSVKRLSLPGEVWVEPPDRAHFSPTAYLAGRPVVYDAYVGYDYMFVPRQEIESRRHALAQFWQTADAGYATWFLIEYRVRFIRETPDSPLPAAARPFAEALGNGLYSTAMLLPAIPIVPPETIPAGLSGAPFFGEGFRLSEGSPRRREMLPGRAALYLPLPGDRDVRISVEGNGAIVAVNLPGPKTHRGLNRIDVAWEGPAPLPIERVRVKLPPF